MYRYFFLPLASIKLSTTLNNMAKLGIKTHVYIQNNAICLRKMLQVT